MRMSTAWKGLSCTSSCDRFWLLAENVQNCYLMYLCSRRTPTHARLDAPLELTCARPHSAARVVSSRGARAPRRLLRRARPSPDAHRAVAAAQRRIRGTMCPSIDTLSASVLGGRCALWSDARGARARSASLSMSSRSCSTSVACTLERSDAHDVLSTSLVGHDSLSQQLQLAACAAFAPPLFQRPRASQRHRHATGGGARCSAGAAAIAAACH